MTIGVATASSGYIGALYNWFNPPIAIDIGGFRPDLYREDLRHVYLAWGASNAYCNISVRNIGHVDVTIAQVIIDNTTITPDTPIMPCVLTKDSSLTIKVTSTFNSRTEYPFMVITAKGNQFGPIRGITP